MLAQAAWAAVTRRIPISLGLLALLATILAWLGRWEPGAHAPEGGTPPDTIDPRFHCEASTVPPILTVGGLFRLRLSVAADIPWSEGEGTLLLGFPHPYYGLRRSRPGEPYPPAPPDPSKIEARTARGALSAVIRGQGYGRWDVEVPLPLGIAAGERVELDIPDLRAPNRPLERFEPLVLVSPEGDQDFRRVCPSLSVRVAAGAPSALTVIVPSRVEPGAQISAVLRQEDSYGNPVGDVVGPIDLRWRPLSGGASVPGPTGVRIEPVQEGVGRIRLPAPPEGAWVLAAAVANEDGRGAESNAILIEDGTPLLGWADLHGHSGLSDGWGTPTDWYRHARNVAALDAAALSDHDWQMDPGELGELLSATEAANDPPGFVTVPAMEINRIGHEVAYLFDASKFPVTASAQGGATTLWAETDLGYPTARLIPPLEPVLFDPSVELVTHSSIMPSMGTAFPLVKEHPNWRVLEIYSAHGSSECVDCPRSGWRPRSGDDGDWGSARDALAAGYRLGFIAAGDSHDGRPGTSHWGAQSGGLAGIYWSEPSRDGLHEALHQRHVYGTTGRRTIIDFSVDGVPMGGEVPAAATHRIRLRVIDAKPATAVTVVRNGVEWRTIERPLGWMDIEDAEPDPAWWYLRATIEGGDLAWSSPVFVEDGG